MSSDMTRALDTSRNVVVEACAGSGKTWLLSSRIARALVEGTPPGAILALTFTNKAAAEMRNRVLGSLKELALADSEKLRATLTSWGLQGAALSQAMQAAPGAFAALIMSPQPPTISTFHSWYSRLAAMAPLSMAGAATMSLSAQPWDLMRKAWQEFFAHGVNDVPYEALVRLMGAYTVRKAMEDWVHARIEWQAFGSQLPGFGALGKKQAETELAQAHDTNAKAILAFYEQHRGRAAALAKAYAQVEKREDVVALLTAWNPADLDRLSARFLSPIKPKDRSGSPPQRLRIKGGNVSLIRQADLKRWGDQAQHTATEIQALVEALIALLDAMDSRVCQARTQALWICGRRLAQCLDQVMARQHEIDFTGLEAVAWNLMGGESAAAFHARLDTQVQHVLVDEFQDTNPTQWAMLRAWLSQYLQADVQLKAQAPKVFLVGDPKQSIYRFRRADPQVFQVASGWLAENFNAVLLQANATRRCGPQVVAFLNDCMPTIAADDRYHAHESLAPQNKGFVRRLPIAADWQQEGAQIAQALLALRSEQPDLEWSQVRILVRARKKMADYESALLAAGIPFVSDRPGGLLKSPEICDMIALLRCLAFPWSDADRAQVLSSAIAELSLRGSQSEPWQSIPEDWFTWASELPVHDLLDRIIHQHDLFNRMAARYGPTRGLQCLANLEAFTALALELDTGRLPSLPRFLQEIHRLAQAKDSDAPGLGIMSAADAVSLSTLHSAKGLEARVVVLAGLLDRDKPDSGLRWLIHWNNERDRILGVAGWQSGDPYTDTVIHALADDERQARDEDFNLLYVGVTRAKQFLIFSATQGAKEADDKWFTRITPYCEEWGVPHQGPEPDVGNGGQKPLQAGWPGQLFDKRDLSQATAAVADSLAIRQGKALHRLLEHGPSLGPQAIDRLIAPFALPSFARNSVIKALALLKSSSPVMEMFRAECLAYAEAEWPIEQNGKVAVLRPDRVVRMSESPETWWVIDFKWQVLDSELSDYANQLAGYREAFQLIRPGAAIEAKIVTASAEVWALDDAGELQRLIN